MKQAATKKDTSLAIAKQPKSKFDWHSEPLSLDTVITNSYKSTQNVRRFFRQHCGDDFHFDVLFMAFMKTSSGITLGEAVAEWKRRKQLGM